MKGVGEGQHFRGKKEAEETEQTNATSERASLNADFLFLKPVRKSCVCLDKLQIQIQT